MDDVRYYFREALSQLQWLEDGEADPNYPDQRQDAALVVREALHGLYETVARISPASLSVS